MNDRDWLLGVLSDGRPHSHAEIMRRSETERGHGLTVHSRAADLRKRGHDVQVTTWRANGRTFSAYKLIQCPTEKPEALTAPEASEGWDDQADTEQTCDGDGSQEAVPKGCADGVRAEGDATRDGGGSPCSAPNADQPPLFQISATAQRRGAYDEAA